LGEKYSKDTIIHRIFEKNDKVMKVTALIPDKLIDDVKKLTGGSNITESIIIALNEFTSRQKVLRTAQKIKKQPLSFRDDFSASRIRKLNREA
jgi:hypothetical protein